MEYLIEAGAALDVVNVEGKTPLYLAIVGNAHDSLRILLDHGPAGHQLSNRDQAHALLLEIAARADATTLDIFSDLDIVGLMLEQVGTLDLQACHDAFESSLEDELAQVVRRGSWITFIETLTCE